MKINLNFETVLYIFFSKEEIDNYKKSELKIKLFKRLNLMYVTHIEVAGNFSFQALVGKRLNEEKSIENKVKIHTFLSRIETFIPTTSTYKLETYFNYPEIVNGYINKEKSSTLGDVVKIKTMLDYFGELVDAYEELKRIL